MTPVQAIADALTGLPFDVHQVDAVKYDDSGARTALTFPYALVWQSTGRPGDEPALDDQNADETAHVAVTTVGLTPYAATHAARQVRALLGPATWQVLAVEDVHAHVRWAGFQSANVDRDVTLPDTGRHPAFEVHLYELATTAT